MGKTDEEKAEINEQIDKVFKPIGDLYKRHAARRFWQHCAYQAFSRSR